MGVERRGFVRAEREVVALRCGSRSNRIYDSLAGQTGKLGGASYVKIIPNFETENLCLSFASEETNMKVEFHKAQTLVPYISF